MSEQHAFSPGCSPSRRAAQVKQNLDNPLYGQTAESYTNPIPAWDPTVKDFDVVATASIPVDGTWHPVATFQMPAGCIGWGKWFGQDCAVASAFQDVSWRITVNGGVYILYPNIAQIASLAVPTPINVPVNQHQTIAVECLNQNGGNTARTVNARIKGVFHPAVRGEAQ